MATSKFVEILDTTNAPYSHENVSLDDVLEDVRHRSPSTDSNVSPSTEKAPSRDQSPTIAAPTKSRLRGFSLMKGKT